MSERVIKFRAWFTCDAHPNGIYIYSDTGEFRVANNPDKTGLLMNLNGDLLLSYHKDGTTHGIVWLRIGANDISLEQFTGLNDKNGKEIYHNSIVRFWLWNEEMPTEETQPHDFAPVVWNDYGCCWAVDWKGELHSLSGRRELEIIGNVHEEAE